MPDYARQYRALRKVFRVQPGGALPIPTGSRYGKRSRLPLVSSMLGHKTGAEIGVRRGGFSMLFFKEIPDLEMWCVDPWGPVPRYSQERQDRIFEDCRRNLHGYKANLIRRSSLDALCDVPGNLDFLHIDASHEFDDVMQDMIHWIPKVTKGGLVMIHDYHLPDVRHAIDAYTRAHHIDPWFTLKDSQPTALWINE